ncbi:MAG: glycosyltransferase family 2 protein [Vicinamibacterales bacterium]
MPTPVKGEKPSVSIIIRCFNEERHIGTLLERIYAQTVRDPEVIVVDSGSTDDTLTIVERFPVRLVCISPTDFTFGYSLNQGCRLASGTCLVFASAHVVPCREDWLERLIEPFADALVALVYGRQLGNERTKFSEHQLFAKQYPAESNPDQRIPFCNNANAAVRRSLWLEHPYDETLSGLEDLAWGKWAVERGHRIAYQADAAVFHIHDESPAQIKRRHMREALALKRIFPDSHVTFLQFLGLLASNVTRDLLAALRRGEVVGRFGEILMFRGMQYWGTYRGMNYRSPLTHELIMRFYYPRPLRRTNPAVVDGVVPEGEYDGTRR